MIDKSNDEINAIQAAFPGTRPLICDFHRLQAWDRWLKNSANGVPSSRKKSIMAALRAVAVAEADIDFAHRVKQLERPPDFIACPQIISYFQAH